MLAKTQVDLLRVLEQREVRRLGGEDADPPRRPAGRRHPPGHRRPGRRAASCARTCTTGSTWSPSACPRSASAATTSPCSSSTSSRRAQRRHGREPKQVAGAAMRVLCDYSWPGNVRQLRNCMERLVVTVEGPIDPRRRPARGDAGPRRPAATTWPVDLWTPEAVPTWKRRRRGEKADDPRGPGPAATTTASGPPSCSASASGPCTTR